ncbi:MAG TPA: M14 family metallopeptidase [Bacteroidota bacterium]
MIPAGPLRQSFRGLLISLVLLVQSAPLASQAVPQEWLTAYELSGFKKTPRYAETIEYCRRLQAASGWIRVDSFGRTPEGRSLQLVIASSDGAFDPASARRSGKAVVMIQNGIHAGEIDGKDACLMLLRDMAITKSKASLLDHVILLVIPVYNVDGHERFGPFNRINQNGPEEMGWRVTAQNLNLNRDYLKADAPETRAWLKVYTSWLPDFFVDCHVTDGADFQHVFTYSIETHENVAAPVRAWITRGYIPFLESKLTSAGVSVIPYIFLKDDTDPLLGILGSVTPPRFSTSYTPLQNRPGLLIETHMLKDYKTRVEATRAALEATIERVGQQYRELRRAVSSADSEAEEGFRQPYPLQFSMADKPNATVHFLGYKQKNEKSTISGGEKIRYTHEPFEADIPRFDSSIVTKTVVPPRAYLIPQQWTEVLDRLDMHGVRIERLTVPIEVEVETYRFSHAHWQQAPFEGRHPVTYSVENVKERRAYPAGTAVVRLNQRAARVALNALEPEAPDAFAAWGFFDAIFEQKEYAENYVMEPLASEMLAKDPNLKKEFETRLAADTAFAHSPGARLNFFYQRSPYWDPQVNSYPVARLMSDVPLQTEPFRF